MVDLHVNGSIFACDVERVGVVAWYVDLSTPYHHPVIHVYLGIWRTHTPTEVQFCRLSPEFYQMRASSIVIVIFGMVAHQVYPAFRIKFEAIRICSGIVAVHYDATYCARDGYGHLLMPDLRRALPLWNQMSITLIYCKMVSWTHVNVV